MAVLTASPVDCIFFLVWKPLNADWILTVASCTPLSFRSGKSSSSSFFATTLLLFLGLAGDFFGTPFLV